MMNNESFVQDMKAVRHAHCVHIWQNNNQLNLNSVVFFLFFGLKFWNPNNPKGHNSQWYWNKHKFSFPIKTPAWRDVSQERAEVSYFCLLTAFVLS